MRPQAVVQALLVLLLLLLCLILAALCAAPFPGRVGGALARGSHAAQRRKDPADAPHLVVDTLNLTHWLFEPGPAGLSPALIVQAIDESAPVLKRHHPGRVMYVLKDRESQFNDDASREAYRLAAERNGVYVTVAERYVDPPKSGQKPSAAAEHSSLGRDDFYMSLLAYRHRCAVLTADQLRDFSRFRATIPPFHVTEFAFWRQLPVREFIRPESPSYARMRKPRTIHPETYFAVRPACQEPDTQAKGS